MDIAVLSWLFVVKLLLILLMIGPKGFGVFVFVVKLWVNPVLVVRD